ncbi:MAG TPA: hypothetical protein VL096_14655, partial [Pirellulaceae bacterium]|nr:hypothetical protein [Pirellulaceae bacterium]
FLSELGRCRIHEEFGAEAKPLVCRMFPLQFVPHEEQAMLTLRRACPSAAADEGRELSVHLSEARRLADEGSLVDQGAAAPLIKPGEATDWKRSRMVLEALRRITCDERFPPVHRLVQGLEFCRLLDLANTREFSHGKQNELVGVLEGMMADEAAPHFAERAEPSAAARMLFRQWALELVGLHPGWEVQASWRHRFQRAWWALRMARGRGQLPQAHRAFAEATFEQLEEPLGRLDAAVYQPLFRYFETSTSSCVYALANRRGWSVIESYRQLALLYPLAMWLLRWKTFGRPATPQDMVEIVVALDRSQGYAPLSGAKQRSRISTLNKLQSLAPLTVWYAR